MSATASAVRGPFATAWAGPVGAGDELLGGDVGRVGVRLGLGLGLGLGRTGLARVEVAIGVGDEVEATVGGATEVAAGADEGSELGAARTARVHAAITPASTAAPPTSTARRVVTAPP